MPIALLTLLACTSDQKLTSWSDVASSDTAGLSDSADTDALEEPAPTGETGEVSPGCREFTFSWSAPVVGETLWAQGEFTDPWDGTVLVGWQDHAVAENTHQVSFSLSLCQPFTWRGQGAADTDGDGTQDLWSCQRQSLEEEYALSGAVGCAVDGIPTEVEIRPSDGSDGCEVICMGSS